ncbi:MAG: Peptidoglycan synthase FtsI, partial [Alphaproteobacteria bacterium MarineAlpha3_Bin7]
TPLHLCQGISALVNGGFLTEATLIKKKGRRGNVNKRVISDKTSSILKNIMRSVVRFGTGKKADVEGYLVGGKTGTAEKPDNIKRGYNSGKLLSSFVGVFPSNQPKYIVFVMLDEPKGIKSTFGKATGGWVAAPTVGNIIRQIVIINGMAPNRVSEKKLNPGDPMYIKPEKVRKNKQIINKTGASKFENKLKDFLRKETKLGGLKVEVN